MKANLSQVRGVARSLWMYYGHPRQMQRMARLYGQFIAPGDVAFDIGAHVGSRTLAWSRLGARVVAVEPVPQAVRTLRVLFGRSANVALVPAAVGADAGMLPMLVSEREPTVSTLSAAWADRMVRERDAFARTRWERSVDVPVTTLDALIARYGQPAFCKIDTEGYDLEVLRGLSRPVRCLSFEYVPPALDLVLECLARLSELGLYTYNWSPGESMHLRWHDWVDADTLVAYLRAYPRQGNPGDVYARLAR
jgi:FkbM family methyltransferase